MLADPLFNMSLPASSPVFTNAPSTSNIASTGLLLLLTGIGYNFYQATQSPIITVSQNAYITKKSSIMIGFCNNFFGFFCNYLPIFTFVNKVLLFDLL